MRAHLIKIVITLNHATLFRIEDRKELLKRNLASKTSFDSTNKDPRQTHELCSSIE